MIQACFSAYICTSTSYKGGADLRSTGVFVSFVVDEGSIQASLGAKELVDTRPLHAAGVHMHAGVLQ